MDLVIVGSIALDDIKTPYGEEDNILGGSATYSSISACRFAKTGVVGVVGQDFPTQHVDLLKANGVDISGLGIEDGKTFHWKGYYEGDMAAAHTVDTQLGVFGEFDPVLPEAYRKAPFLFLGNIHPTLQMSVLDQMTDTRFVGLDSMNLWIDTTPDELEQVIRRVDVVFLNDAETRAIGKKLNLNAAAAEILNMGPVAVICKRGEGGASVHMKDMRFWAPAVGLMDVYDPTGAGDTFAGAVMGYLASRQDHPIEHLREATVLGNVLASFTVEDFSVRGLLRADTGAIRRRIEQIRAETVFGGLEIH